MLVRPGRLGTIGRTRGLVLPPPALNALRIIATSGRIPNAQVTSATLGTRRSYKTRQPEFIGAGCTEGFRLYFDRWSMQNGIVLPVGDEVLQQVSVSLDDGTTWAKVTFGGADSLTLASGAKQVPSDIVTPSMLGLTTFARGRKLWIKIVGNHPAGSDMLLHVGAKMTGGYSAYFDPATQSPTAYSAANFTFVSGENVQNLGRGATCLIGRPDSASAGAVIGLGDSILDGANDTLTSMRSTGFGYFQAAQVGASDADPIPGLNLTRNGTTTAHWLNATARTYWEPYLAYATMVVDNLGTNDFGTGPGSGAAAALDTAIRQLWEIYRTNGIGKILRTKLQPRSSNASGTSAASQTIAAGWDVGGQRDIFNAGLASALSAGTIDALVDLNTVWEDQAALGRWVTNATTNYATVDGTHPSAALHTLSAPILRSAILANGSFV